MVALNFFQLQTLDNTKGPETIFYAYGKQKTKTKN